MLLQSFQPKVSVLDVVAGLAWSEDPESYAGGSIATGRGSHAGQVKGDDPDKKGYPGLPDWGLGVGLTTPPFKNGCFETSTEDSGVEEEGWGGHGPKTDRSAIEDEEDDHGIHLDGLTKTMKSIRIADLRADI
jgi:hypothetical protein